MQIHGRRLLVQARSRSAAQGKSNVYGLPSIQQSDPALTPRASPRLASLIDSSIQTLKNPTIHIHIRTMARPDDFSSSTNYERSSTTGDMNARSLYRALFPHTLQFIPPNIHNNSGTPSATSTTTTTTATGTYAHRAMMTLAYIIHPYIQLEGYPSFARRSYTITHCIRSVGPFNQSVGQYSAAYTPGSTLCPSTFQPAPQFWRHQDLFASRTIPQIHQSTNHRFWHPRIRKSIRSLTDLHTSMTIQHPPQTTPYQPTYI